VVTRCNIPCALPVFRILSSFLCLIGVLLPFLVISGCARSMSRRPVPPLVSTPSPARPSTGQTGVASWYGPGFHGQSTASGERYDQNALTAAHRTLPLGTRVKVTNLSNGKSVHVRINDRGPYVRGRVIDLSRGAARKLGMEKRGVGKVRITPLSPQYAARRRSSTSREPTKMARAKPKQTRQRSIFATIWPF
jgi:rare lipoprotein A (peptidoglycan hydrolase)